ncbi:MAG: hypothetical protein JWM21_4548 [Acidobacteria bacterium]|nr:hypothetical protein [Acidobacteriota bacterium]
MASGKSGVDGNKTTYGETENGVVKWNRAFYGLNVADAALQILHESLHLLPGFTDFAVASEAAILAHDPKRKFADQSEASRYINDQISVHCGGKSP